MPAWTTMQLVDELLSRCHDGVFAWATVDGQVRWRLNPNDILVFKVGLAALLEEQCALASRDTSARSEVARLAKPYLPLAADVLEFAKTDELLAELCRATPGSWVLGLLRRKPQGRVPLFATGLGTGQRNIPSA